MNDPVQTLNFQLPHYKLRLRTPPVQDRFKEQITSAVRGYLPTTRDHAIEGIHFKRFYFVLFASQMKTNKATLGRNELLV